MSTLNNVKKAFITSNSKQIYVYKIFEVINGKWQLIYQGGIKLPDDLVQALIDFEYIDNKDGTVTLTEWKGTYNGVPSNTLAIPEYK